jgi:hypothetical protein
MDYLKYSKTTFELLHRDVRYNHQCDYDRHATTMGCPRLLPKHRMTSCHKNTSNMTCINVYTNHHVSISNVH